MSFQVSTASVQEFKTIVSLLLQQQGSRLRPAVNVQAFVGKAVSVVEQFGPVTAVRNSGRHSDTPLISTPQDRRWCFPNDYDWADLIDRHNKPILMPIFLKWLCSADNDHLLPKSYSAAFLF